MSGHHAGRSMARQRADKKGPPSHSLHETLERAFRNVEASAVGTDAEDDVKDLFDDTAVNSNKLGPTVVKG